MNERKGRREVSNHLSLAKFLSIPNLVIYPIYIRQDKERECKTRVK